jgi:hypothetical protein
MSVSAWLLRTGNLGQDAPDRNLSAVLRSGSGQADFL